MEELQQPPRSTPSHSSSIRWWQWVIMYPSLFVALMGNVPNLQDAWTAMQTGIPFNLARQARVQAELWERNQDCIGEDHPVSQSQTNELAISVMSCPTGDLLVSLKDANPHDRSQLKPIRQWVEFTTDTERVASRRTSLLPQLFVSSAIAATLNHTSQSGNSLNHENATQIAQTTVVCQKMLGEGRILRKLRDANGNCIDEIVNTFTGEVISQTPSSQCGC